MPDNTLAEIPDSPPAAGHVREIVPGLLWLRMPLPFALDHVNLWLLEEEDGYTLVDCGYGDATTRAHWERHSRRRSPDARFGASSPRIAILIIWAMPRGWLRATAVRSR
jgi:hypothetical protein